MLSEGERAQQYVVGDEEIGTSTEVPPLSGDSLPDTADEIEIVDSSDSEEEEEDDEEDEDEISNVNVEVYHVRVCVHVYTCMPARDSLILPPSLRPSLPLSLPPSLPLVRTSWAAQWNSHLIRWSPDRPHRKVRVQRKRKNNRQPTCNPLSQIPTPILMPWKIQVLLEWSSKVVVAGRS